MSLHLAGGLSVKYFTVAGHACFVKVVLAEAAQSRRWDPNLPLGNLSSWVKHILLSNARKSDRQYAWP